MKHSYYADVPLEDVTMDGAKKVKIRWLVSAKDGAPNFAMRMFEVEPGGYTPYHSHEWEHENYILEGVGHLKTEDGDVPFKPGDILYVEPHMYHNYVNDGDSVMKFLCMVPNEYPKKKKKKVNVNPFATGIANNC